MEPWIGNWNTGSGTYVNVDGCIFMYPSTHPQTLYVRKSGDQISSDFSLGFASMYLRRITFKYMFYDILGGFEHDANNYMTLVGTAFGQSAQNIWVQYFVSPIVKNTWYDVTIAGATLQNLQTIVLEKSNIALRWESRIVNVHSNAIGFRVDEIKLYLDESL